MNSQKETTVRSAALAFVFICLFSLTEAKEPQHDPSDPYWGSIRHRRFLASLSYLAAREAKILCPGGNFFDEGR
jgi:hypothetical protein